LLGLGWGSSGSITAHSASSISGCFMSTHRANSVPGSIQIVSGSKYPSG
jgi:hypothetical protein